MRYFSRNLLALLFVTIFHITPVNGQIESDDQVGVLTLPIDITSVNSHFDLDSGENRVEDTTGYTCEGADMCDSTPGNHAYDGHNGVDLNGTIGTQVIAAGPGTVTFVRNNYDDNWHPSQCCSYGNYVVIENTHENIVIYYAHLQGGENILVENGQEVQRGDVIATADNTGSSTASHLHFEVRRDGEAIDPFHENLWITEQTDEEINDTDHILTAGEYALQNNDNYVDKSTSDDGIFSSIWNRISSWFSLEGEGGGPTAHNWTNEEALVYVKDAEVVYSDQFLEWVGWRNIEPDRSTPELIEFFKRHPNFIRQPEHSMLDLDALDQLVRSHLGEGIKMSDNYDFEGVNEESIHAGLNLLLENKFPPSLLFENTILRKYFDDFYSKVDGLASNNEEVPLFSSNIPDTKFVEKLSAQGLRYIDESYDFTEHNLPWNGKFALDTVSCDIPKDVTEKLSNLADRKYYYSFMEMVWLSSLPPFMKFFLQEKMDTNYSEARYILNLINKNHFYCVGLLHFSDGQFLWENYRNFDFVYLNEVYNKIKKP